MHAPLVSILIPAHNAAPWIRETLDSALAQTWRQKEVIVVENGSVDETLAIARSYEASDVRVFSIPKSSAAAARNRAFAVSNGRFIQYLDADDLLSPSKIEVQVAQLEDRDDSLSLCALGEFFDGEDLRRAAVYRSWPFVASSRPASWLADLLGRNGKAGYVALHQWLTPRALILRAGPWNETLTVQDDGEFFCRVILRSSEIKTALEPVAFYRRHRTSTSLSSAYRRTPAHARSMLRAIDLIVAQMIAAGPDPELKKALARHYYDCALLAHPLDPSTSRDAEAKALSLDPNAKAPPPTSRMASSVRHLFGWRAERQVSSVFRAIARSLRRCR